MVIAYEVMYRIGFTPWDNHPISEPLSNLVESATPGHMFDIGCGTGHDAVFAASHGWRVTGLDAVSIAVRRARRNVADAGVAASVTVVQGDVALIDPSVIGRDVTLLQDMGCFAGLKDDDRARAAALINAVSLPGAHMLLFYFGPGSGRGPGPRRLSPTEVAPLFPEWDVEFSRPADDVLVKGPLSAAPRFWHQLVKR